MRGAGAERGRVQPTVEVWSQPMRRPSRAEPPTDLPDASRTPSTNISDLSPSKMAVYTCHVLLLERVWPRRILAGARRPTPSAEMQMAGALGCGVVLLG